MKILIKMLIIAGFILGSTNAAYCIEDSTDQIKNLVYDRNNSIGITYSENKILDAADLVKEKRIVEAKKIVVPVIEWLEESTEHHANLYRTLRNVENAKAQADIERDLALKTAVLRDKGMFQLALIYLQEGKKEQAIEQFVNIMRSQPTTELGFKSYEKLQEVGFTYKAVIEKKTEEIE